MATVQVYGLTLWQPHATLMAIRAKQIETRSRSTTLWQQRPWIAIHAAASTPASWIRAAMAEPAIRAALADHDITIDNRTHHNMPTRAILLVGRLVDCRPTEVLNGRVGPAERAMGDYRAGRFGLIFEQLRPLLNPITINGQQGFWKVPDDIVDRIDQDLRSTQRRLAYAKGLD